MSVILVVAFIKYGKNFLLNVSLSTSPKEFITSVLVSFSQSENSVESKEKFDKGTPSTFASLYSVLNLLSKLPPKIVAFVLLKTLLYSLLPLKSLLDLTYLDASAQSLVELSKASFKASSDISALFSSILVSINFSKTGFTTFKVSASAIIFVLGKTFTGSTNVLTGCAKDW